MLGNILFCTMVGYALARRRVPLKGFWLMTVVAVLMIPPQVVMIPLYRMMVTFGWINAISPSLLQRASGRCGRSANERGSGQHIGARSHLPWT